MHDALGWAAETPNLFTATLGTGRPGPRGFGLKHYLVVEALPQGGWDWVAWADDGSGRCLHDTCDTRACAMRAAELAALLLAETETKMPRDPITPVRALN